jgi:hypothetical protein
MAAPGQRFIAQAQAARGGPLGRCGEVGNRAFAIAISQREQLEQTSSRSVPSSCITSNLLEPVERAGALRLGQAVEVAERLEHRAGQARSCIIAAISRAEMRGEQVVLENLRVIPGIGDRVRSLASSVPEIETVAMEVLNAGLVMAVCRLLPLVSCPGGGLSRADA